MSEQHVFAFLDKVKTDTTLQARIKALKSSRLDDLIQLANNAGFTFTADEWQAIRSTSFGEINDEALDQVAGGAGPIQCNLTPAALLCNEKPVGILCNDKPTDFSNSLTLFKLFGK